jgi:hypothetical protein
MNKNDCFIIAPISTPEDIRPTYRSDENHFKNVLAQLIVPAVKKAGFNPIPPIMEGSDVIHAKIIRNLEQAPLVLCDISTAQLTKRTLFGSISACDSQRRLAKVNQARTTASTCCYLRSPPCVKR